MHWCLCRCLEQMILLPPEKLKWRRKRINLRRWKAKTSLQSSALAFLISPFRLGGKIATNRNCMEGKKSSATTLLCTLVLVTSLLSVPFQLHLSCLVRGKLFRALTISLYMFVQSSFCINGPSPSSVEASKCYPRDLKSRATQVLRIQISSDSSGACDSKVRIFFQLIFLCFAANSLRNLHVTTLSALPSVMYY